MRPLARCCVALSLSLSLFGLACGDSGGGTDSDGSGTEAPLTACDWIPGSSWQTVEKFGTGPGGTLAHLPLDFDESGGYIQSFGDYGEEGTFTCADGVLTMTTATNEYTATLNDDATELMTDYGTAYERVEP